MAQKDDKTSVAAKKARKRGNQAAHNARLKEAAVMSGYSTIGKLAKAIRDGEAVVSPRDAGNDKRVLEQAAVVLGCSVEYLDGLRIWSSAVRGNSAPKR